MSLVTAFALTPGWWVVMIVVVLLVLALAYGNATRKGSGITPRQYRRPTSATPAPGSNAPSQVSGRDEARQAWEGEQSRPIIRRERERARST